MKSASDGRFPNVKGTLSLVKFMPQISMEYKNADKSSNKSDRMMHVHDFSTFPGTLIILEIT